jgi:hypothetical protein
MIIDPEKPVCYPNSLVYDVYCRYTTEDDDCLTSVAENLLLQRDVAGDKIEGG